MTLRRIRRPAPFPRMTAAAAALAAVLGACATATPPPAPQASDDPAALQRALWDMAAGAQRSAEYTAAAQHYAAILRSAPDNESAILGRARNLRYAGQPYDAALFLEDAVSRLGPRPALRLELAKAYVADDAPDKALPILLDLRTARESDWQVASTLGIVYDRQGLPEKALEAHRQAYALAPKEPQTANNLALSLAMAGRLDEAVDILTPVAKRSDAPLHAVQNLALLHAMRGDLERAEALTREALPPALAEETIRSLRAIARQAGRR